MITSRIVVSFAHCSIHMLFLFAVLGKDTGDRCSDVRETFRLVVSFPIVDALHLFRFR